VCVEFQYSLSNHRSLLATDMYIGTLQDLVKGKYQWSDIGDEKEVLLQITKGLAYLHHKGIIHRDIQPTTIVIDNKMKKMKLAYFGICSFLIENQPTDLSSKGCIFYYTLTVEAKHPFGKYPIEQSLRIQKKDKTISLEMKDFKSPYINDAVAIIKLIQSMCKMEPNDRPGTKEILENNEFFTERNVLRAQTDEVIDSQSSITRKRPKMQNRNKQSEQDLNITDTDEDIPFHLLNFRRVFLKN